MAASSRKTWKSVEEFLVSFGETTLYGKIQNSVPKAFTSTHRSTLLCSNFVKCCRREIDEIVHYLPDKKLPAFQTLATARITPKICHQCT